MKSIEMDFVKDWQEEMIKQIRNEGIEFLDTLSNDLLIIRYFTYLRKKGVEQPHNIHKSKEFKCPSYLQNGLDKLIEVLENGRDVSPYLSKQVNEITSIDRMFNDWGVIHLHLGEEMEANNQYIKRTGPLLFAYFKGKDVYLINVFYHGEWTKKEVMQTIYNNWPELIQPFVLNEVVGLEHEYTEAEHKQLRNASINVPVELKDKEGNNFVIHPLGMGMATSGDSVNDVMGYQRQIKDLRNLEEKVKNNIDLIQENMKKGSISIPKLFRFKLLMENNKWKVKELNTRITFNFK